MEIVLRAIKAKSLTARPLKAQLERTVKTWLFFILFQNNR